MVWSQIEATPPHLTFLILSSFLLLYAFFSSFIRNNLHLSEPPLALLTGIFVGPRGLNALDPRGWGWEDHLTQEFTRLILGLQVFVVGLELPRRYLPRHWRSIVLMLGPVMTFGWLICAVFVKYLFNTSWPTALVASACLTPTDPVLAASVLSESRFSARVPARLKNLLSCESGCNDGSSFPFLYVGLAVLTNKGPGGAIKEWLTVTILWQCVFGIVMGVFIGYTAHLILKYADDRKLISEDSFLAIYLLLAVLSVGVGSTLGLDDFLVAFSAGVGFALDGWFTDKTRESNLNNVLDLILNSTFFVYFGTIIPWDTYMPRAVTPMITPWRLLGFLALVLCFRRIPIVLALKRFIPDIRTYREALFAGHFGPMGVGACFLVIEARAQLQTGSAEPLPQPDPSAPNYEATELIWPIVSFIVLGSTLIHGFSVVATSAIIHYTRDKEERAETIGGETDPLGGMIDDDDEDGEEQEEDAEEEENRRRDGRQSGRISLPL